MLVLVAAFGYGILVADDERASGAVGVVAEGAMGGESVEEKDGACFHGHRHSALEVGGAMSEGEFAVAGVVSDHVGGSQSVLMTAGHDPDTAVLLITFLQGDPGLHAAIAYRMLRVVGVVLMPVADLSIVRILLKEFG